MINGTKPVFLLSQDYGSTTKYEFQDIFNSKGSNNFCYSNAEKLHPVAIYDLAVSIVRGYQYCRDFFIFVGGGQDDFCFYDPIDHYVHYPFYDTKKGVTTEGVVLTIGSKLFLAKKYSLGSYFVHRIITRPKENDITVYNSDGSIASVSVNWDTGEIVSGGNSLMKWSGYFYVPVRFENDLLPLEAISFTKRNNIKQTELHRIGSLVFKEVLDTQLSTPSNLPNSELNHTFDAPFENGYASDLSSITSIIGDGANFEKRTQIRSVNPQFTIPETYVNYGGKEYLISLYRLCLGNNKSLIIDDSNNSGYNDFFTFSEFSIKHESASGIHEFRQDFKYSAKFDSAFDKIATQYCHCWLLVRKDGNQYGFTNHDCELSINGVTYHPKGSYKPSSPSRSAENTEPQTIELGSYLTTEITEEDVVTDKFKDCKLLLFYYDWQNSVKISNIYEGFITSSSMNYLSTGAISYKLFGESLFKLINVDVQVETSPNCRAKFLSDECGRAKDGFVSQTRIITDIEDIDNRISVSIDVNLETDPDGLASWGRGSITFLDGKLIGLSFPVAFLISQSKITLKYRPVFLPEIGDRIEIIKGCQKNPSDCFKWNNSANYKGEPRASGELVRYPTPSYG